MPERNKSNNSATRVMVMLTLSMSCWNCKSIGGQRQSAREEQVKQQCYEGDGDADLVDVVSDL